jgi:CopG antitoxin of type II toxin-antitoxin system
VCPTSASNAAAGQPPFRDHLFLFRSRGIRSRDQQRGLSGHAGPAVAWPARSAAFMDPRTSEAEVAEYWLTHDSAGEVDWKRARVRLEFDTDVERPTRSVTLRLPRRLLQELKVLAKDRDVPYQSFMKILLAEKVADIRRKTG